MGTDPKLLEKYVDSENKIATINGLLIAQAICARRFMDAFDAVESTEIVMSIMDDIVKTIEQIKGE